MTAGANLSDDKHEKNQYWQLVINKLSGINNPNGYLFEAFNSRLYQTYFQIRLLERLPTLQHLHYESLLHVP